MILQLLLALLLPSSSGALSLFMRTTWLAEVPEPVWRSWFELIARGRREGPASPFYVAELGLQNTACCENGPDSRGCLGAKCSDLGLQPNSLLTKQPDAPSEYFPLFDKVHVGTTAYYDPKTLKPWNRRNRAIVYDAGEELFLLISACSEHPFYLHTLAGVIWRPRGNLTVQITPVQRGDIWSWLRG